MKVILDVNVWISALLWDGVPDQVVLLAEQKKITIFASPELFIELETALCRPKFAAKLCSLNLRVQDALGAVREIQYKLAIASILRLQNLSSRENTTHF